MTKKEYLKRLYNTKENLTSRFYSDIAFVAGAVDESRLRSGQTAVDAVCTAFNDRRAPLPTSIEELRESSIFKLARVLRTEEVTTWESFKKHTAIVCPKYARAPRNFLDLAPAIPWKVSFPVPPTRKQKKRRGKTETVISAAPGVDNAQVLVDRVFALEQKVLELQNKAGSSKDSTTEYDELMHLIKNHVHIGDNVYELKKIGE